MPDQMDEESAVIDVLGGSDFSIADLNSDALLWTDEAMDQS